MGLGGFGAGGGGGYSSKITGTNIEGLYTYEDISPEDTVFVGTDSAFAERRTKTFANDGVRGTEDRTIEGGSFVNSLGPNEQEYVYTWEKDISTVTGGLFLSGSSPRYITYDGGGYISTDTGVNYIYELDTDFNVTGGRFFPNSISGMEWNGNRYLTHVTNVGLNDHSYVYELDTGLNILNKTEIPHNIPSGIAWNGEKYVSTDSGADYIYELDSNFNVIGGTQDFAAFGQPDGILWDGETFNYLDSSKVYMYELNPGLDEVLGGTDIPQGFTPIGLEYDGEGFLVVDNVSGYMYKFRGSYDFTAGRIS